MGNRKKHINDLVAQKLLVLESEIILKGKQKEDPHVMILEGMNAMRKVKIKIELRMKYSTQTSISS